MNNNGDDPRRPMRLQAVQLLLSLLLLLSPLLCSAGSFEPLSTSPPPFKTVTHPLPLSPYWTDALRQSAKNVPTCRWWENLVLQPPNQPVTVSPLSVRVETAETSKLEPYNRTAEYESCWTDRTGTHCPSWSTFDADSSALLSSPSNQGKRGLNFGLPVRESSVEMVATFYRPGFAFSAVEPLRHHKISAWDQMSVRVQFEADGATSTNRVEFPLVRGMPYATGLYFGLTPFLYTQNAILRANDQDLPGEIKADRIKLVMNNGQSVVVYAWERKGEDDDQPDQDDEPLQWKWDRNTVQLTGPGSTQRNWVVRLAFLPAASEQLRDPEMSAAVTAATQESIYDKYATTYPTGGDFDYDFTSSEDDDDEHAADAPEPAQEMLKTTIKFTTGSRLAAENTNSTEEDTDDAVPLLMMSLPHAQATFVAPSIEAGLALTTLTGTMQAVTGSVWTMLTPAAPISWRAPRPVSPSRLASLKTQLLVDAKQSTTAGEPDPYGFGKSIAKIGRLALMAEELEMDAGLIQGLVEIMKDYLVPWLTGANSDALLYDVTYGGIVSTNGLADAGADFGQAYYNDHHFHYGYILYGLAVVAKYDRAWVAGYREEVLALARDYANPSRDDVWFTQMRQMDVFDSHSWAAGLFVFADGRNQESSSEAVNSYYALSLLGIALDHAPLRQWGRMLATLEIQGARWYWHSTTAQSVYPQVYADNKCVGMVWSDKVVDATWFAAGKVFIHGINMLPFTPLTESLLTAPWVAEEYPVVFASITPAITDEWKGFLWGDHAIIDAAQAWTQIENLNTFDGGNTRSNLMYFAATRPAQAGDDEPQIEQEWNDGAGIGLEEEEATRWNDSRVALE